MGIVLGLVFFFGMVFWYFYIAKFLIHKMFGVKYKLDEIAPPMAKGLFVATLFNIPSYYIGNIPSYRMSPDEASVLGLIGIVITFLGFYVGVFLLPNQSKVRMVSLLASGRALA